MRISEVSEQSGLSADTLRYYERIGLLPPVRRDESGNRDYSELDLRRVGFIKCMRRVGFPLDTLVEYYGLVQQGDETIEARKEMLKQQREQLLKRMAEIRETLDLVDHKLEVYENLLIEREKALIEVESE
jgi:DNA-binding transcriptional MerR regulator